MPSIIIRLLALQLLYLPKATKSVMQKRLNRTFMELHQCEMEEIVTGASSQTRNNYISYLQHQIGHKR